MYNSLIHRGISNGTIGVVTEIKEIEDEGFPIVAFPTPNGVEVKPFKEGVSNE